jgi:ribosomal protein L32
MCGMMAARKAILRFGRTVKIQAPAGAVADPDCGQYHLCHAYGKEMRRTGAVSRSHILARDCTDTKENALISDSMHFFHGESRKLRLTMCAMTRRKTKCLR